MDDFSRMIFLYFLKKKSETLNCFRDFVNYVENSTGLKIKKIRSDNGGEYISNDFQKFVSEKGILHEKTVPDSPAQNGRAE